MNGKIETTSRPPPPHGTAVAPRPSAADKTPSVAAAASAVDTMVPPATRLPAPSAAAGLAGLRAPRPQAQLMVSGIPMAVPWDRLLATGSDVLTALHDLHADGQAIALHEDPEVFALFLSWVREPSAGLPGGTPPSTCAQLRELADYFAVEGLLTEIDAIYPHREALRGGPTPGDATGRRRPAPELHYALADALEVHGNDAAGAARVRAQGHAADPERSTALAHYTAALQQQPGAAALQRALSDSLDAAPPPPSLRWFGALRRLDPERHLAALGDALAWRGEQAAAAAAWPAASAASAVTRLRHAWLQQADAPGALGPAGDVHGPELHAFALMLRALRLNGAGRHDEALEACDAAAVPIDDHGERLLQKVLALNGQNRIREAAGAMRAYLEVGGEAGARTALLRGFFALQNSNLAGARGHLQRAVDDPAATPQQRLEAHRDIGVTWQRQGDLKRAVAAWGRALALAPDDVACALLAASGLRTLRRFKTAAGVLARLVEARPQLRDGWSALGGLHLDDEDFPAAAAAYARALALGPPRSDDLINQALALECVGAAAQAAEALAAALALGEAPAACERAIGELMVSPRVHDDAQRMAVCDALIAGGAGSGEVYYRRAMLHRASGAPARAAIDLAAARQRDPGNLGLRLASSWLGGVLGLG